MLRFTSLLFVCITLFSFRAFAQNATLVGTITDADGSAVMGASVYSINYRHGTTTDEKGNYKLKIPAGRKVRIRISHIGFVTLEKWVRIEKGDQYRLDASLETNTEFLKAVEVTAESEELRQEAGVVEIDPMTIKQLPSAFQDFNRILVTLPGVFSNNELSSTYSVRGGNFDENLVYVNNIPIYRPFLIGAGQQEGLSFVNPDMVSNIVFSAGGWQPKYGDKLSSNLVIDYKKPSELGGSVSFGLLGGSAHFENASENGRVSFVGGIRHKNSQYLLSTLETSGQYLPRFTDVQTFVNFDLTNKNSNRVRQTELGWLFSYARNRYLTIPETLETEFGSIQANFRFLVAFDGRETLDYDTYQTGFKLSHKFTDRLKSNLILSGVYTTEREYFEVEGGYRLCDVDNTPGASTINECAVVRAIGTIYDYGRNKLEANLINIENRNEWVVDDRGKMEFGAGVQINEIDDQLREYSFADSADFSTVTGRIFNDLSLNTNQFTHYGQYSFNSLDSMHSFTAGYRMNYWDFSEELLVSPRFQYSFRPNWKRNTLFKVAAGVYSQPPFYRELRDRTGEINTNIKAQRSWHAIASMDRIFYMWGRKFKFVTEAYFKRGKNIIPYEIDNVQIRYFGDNIAESYSAGLDFRLNGQFIEGAESWFSLGLLKTEERIEGVTDGYISRPSDQRVNLGIYFEDRLPTDPSWRIYLNALFGSGLPIGPPGNDQLRNAFNGDEYYRVDIGITKVLVYKKDGGIFNTLWITAEILNALAADNTISYNWIETLNGNQFAIPNALSARFPNIKITANF